MMLTETHVTKDFNDNELKINGYKIERCDSNSRHTGGVIIYIREDIKHKVTYNMNKSRTWILSIQVKESLINGNYSVLYKSPKEKIKDFIEIIEEFFEETLNSESKNIIIGDFNIDTSKKHKNTKRYLSALEPHNLKQIVTDVTRVGNKNSKTIIDHVLTNSNEVSYIINKEESITDHFMIEIKCNTNIKSIKKNEKQKINCWKNYSKEKLCEKLEKIKWEKENCVHKNANQIVLKLKNVMNNLVVQKEVFVKRNKWFNSRIKMLKQEKETAKEKYCFTNDENDRKKYDVKSQKLQRRNQKRKMQ